MSLDYVPGTIVRLPNRPDWGLGRIQSAIGQKVTVNFEDGGKQVVDVYVVALEVVDEDS